MGFTHYLVTRYCEDLRKQIKSLACVFYIPVKQHHSLFNSKRKFPMKRLIFIIASILLGQVVCAQDIIQKKDATEIQAKVLKITDKSNTNAGTIRTARYIRYPQKRFSPSLTRTETKRSSRISIPPGDRPPANNDSANYLVTREKLPSHTVWP